VIAGGRGADVIYPKRTTLVIKNYELIIAAVKELQGNYMVNKVVVGKS